MKSLCKSRVGKGYQQVQVVEARSFLVASLAEGRWCWSSGAQRTGYREQDRTCTRLA